MPHAGRPRRSRTPAEPPKLCPSLQDSRPPSEGLPAPQPSGCPLGPASANWLPRPRHAWGPAAWPRIPTLPSAGPGRVREEAWGRRGGGQTKSRASAMASHVLHTPQRADAPRGLSVCEVAPRGSMTASGRLSPVGGVRGIPGDHGPIHRQGKGFLEGKVGCHWADPSLSSGEQCVAGTRVTPRAAAPAFLGPPSLLRLT